MREEQGGRSADVLSTDGTPLAADAAGTGTSFGSVSSDELWRAAMVAARRAALTAAALRRDLGAR